MKKYYWAYTFQGFYTFLIIEGVILAAAVLLRLFVFKDKTKKNVNFAIWGSTLGAILMHFAIMIAGSRLYRKSVITTLIALYVIFTSYVLAWVFRRKQKAATTAGAFLISSFLVFWLVSAIVSDITIHEYASMIAVWCAVIGIVFAYWLTQLIYLFKEINFGPSTLKLLKNNWFLGPVLALIGVLSAKLTEYPYIWDSADYFSSLVLTNARWDFTLGKRAILIVSGHYGGGMVFLMQPGVWLFEDVTKGVHIMQTALLIVTTVFFYMIVRKLFSKISGLEASLISLIFAVSPATFAQSDKLNLDYIVILLFVWVIFAWLYDIDILKFAFGILFCFSKESAVIVFAGLIFGYYLREFIKRKDLSGIKRLFLCIPKKDWAFAAAPPVIWLSVFKLPSGIIRHFLKKGETILPSELGINVINVASKSGKVKGVQSIWSKMIHFSGIVDEPYDYLNSFAISSKYILIQLSHILLMNFMWVLTGLILVLLVISIVKKVKHETGHIWPLVSAFIVYTLFCCLYITHTHYRYVAVTFTVLLLVFATLIIGVINKKWLRFAIYLILAVIFLIQDYKTVDPVTKAMGYPVYTGEKYIYNEDRGFIYSYSAPLSDYVAYNLEGDSWGLVLSEVTRKIPFEDDTILLIPNEGEVDDYVFFGQWIGRDKRSVYKDNVSESFSAVETKDSKELSCGMVSVEDGKFFNKEDDTKLTDFARCYLVNPPYYNYSEEEIQRMVKLLDRKNFDYIEIETDGWAFKVYELF